MAARLGNVIYSVCCGLTALWLTFAITNLYGPIAVAVWFADHHLQHLLDLPANGLELLVFGLIPASMVWLFGCACRYVLAG
jgi:hypothetical protein